jgi:hypothetical protein
LHGLAAKNKAVYGRRRDNRAHIEIMANFFKMMFNSLVKTAILAVIDLFFRYFLKTVVRVKIRQIRGLNSSCQISFERKHCMASKPRKQIAISNFLQNCIRLSRGF